MQYNADGTYKCPREPDRAFTYLPVNQKRWSLPPSTISSRGTRRYLMDTVYRSTLERYAPALSTLSDFHWRFQQWVRQAVFKSIVHMLAEDIYSRGGTDIREASIHGTFACGNSSLETFSNPGNPPIIPRVIFLLSTPLSRLNL
jgi:hypothetical protein